jgi:mannose-1-phosphate guanylyltransferase
VPDVFVLAGGSGRRLAALTGPTPKQFCAFGGPRTLLEETLERLSPVAPPDRTTVVVREDHLPLARAQVRGRATLLAQPSDRGTAPAILWPLVRAGPDATVIVTPSDHGVRDSGTYRRGLAAALRTVDGAAATLLGVVPDRPSTDLGWIVPDGNRVSAFVEKPGPREADALFARGGLISTMVLVARARELLALFERARPGLVALMLPLAALPPGAAAAHLRRAYAMMPPCDFSREILAGARDLAVVRWPAAVGWTDLGTPERVAEWLRRGPGLAAAAGPRSAGAG